MVMMPSREPYNRPTVGAGGNALASMFRYLCSIASVCVGRKPMGKLEPKGTKVVRRVKRLAHPQPLCDACHATAAKHVIHIGEFDIHLCAHHWRKHLVHIISEGYEHEAIPD